MVKERLKRAASRAKDAVTGGGADSLTVREVKDGQYLIFDTDAGEQHGPYDDRKKAAAKYRELRSEQTGTSGVDPDEPGSSAGGRLKSAAKRAGSAVADASKNIEPADPGQIGVGMGGDGRQPMQPQMRDFPGPSSGTSAAQPPGSERRDPDPLGPILGRDQGPEPAARPAFDASRLGPDGAGELPEGRDPLAPIFGEFQDTSDGDLEPTLAPIFGEPIDEPASDRDRDREQGDRTQPDYPWMF